MQDVLAEQRHTLPFASLCYVLGHADESSLVRLLSQQAGVPGVVFDSSRIDLTLIDAFDPDWLRREKVLPVFQSERRLFLAVADPRRASVMTRQLEFEHDMTIVVHVALHVALSRAIRMAVRARERGETFLLGAEAEPGQLEPTFVVPSMDDDSNDTSVVAREAVVENVTKEVRVEELLKIDESITAVDRSSTSDTARPGLLDDDVYPTGPTNIDLDVAESEANLVAKTGPQRIMIVDDDFASRHLLVKELQPAGYQTVTASGGSEAVRMLKERPPDAVILDVMLPEIDGFQICRAIKQSRKYRHIPVILMSAVIDSGQVSEKVLRRYGADAYFEKPLNTERIKSKLKDLIERTSGANNPRVRDTTFAAALEAYREGRIEEAMQELRKGIADDPLSTKHHFVLANLLQKKDEFYEAIDEYEIVVDLRPDYFPALTRLAYLYYKKGYSAKAVETWRRALPFCPEESLRENIEVFMRKLIAGMQSEV